MSTTNSEKWGKIWGTELLFLFEYFCFIPHGTSFTIECLSHSRCGMNWGTVILLEWAPFCSPLWEVCWRQTPRELKGRYFPCCPPNKTLENDNIYKIIRKLQSHKKDANSTAFITSVIRGIILLVSEEFLKIIIKGDTRHLFYWPQSRTHSENMGVTLGIFVPSLKISSLWPLDATTAKVWEERQLSIQL